MGNLSNSEKVKKSFSKLLYHCLILFKEETNELNWTNLFPEVNATATDVGDAHIQLYIRNQILSNIFESMRVLFKEFTADSSLDVKEKAKSLLKSIN